MNPSRRRSCILLTAVWLCLAASIDAATAGVDASGLLEARAEPLAGARLPMQSAWRDTSGALQMLGEFVQSRPGVVLFVDYTCQTLCSPALGMVARALAQSGLAADEYRLIVLGIDPKDGPEQAAALWRNQIGDELPSAHLLSANADTIEQAEDALGYRVRYDAARDQFAHPLAAYVTDGGGRVVRLLSPLGLGARDLRLAIAEAGGGRRGHVADQLMLLCYGFDPTIGAYSLSIRRGLAVLSIITMLGLGGAIVRMSLSPRSS